MKRIEFDIDIDFADRDQAVSIFPKAVVASIERDGVFEKHNTGIYLQPVPANPLTGLSNIDHRIAEDLGYIKFDFLNLHIYELFETISDLERCVEAEPNWQLLMNKDVVAELIHIRDYHWLIKQYPPSSIEDLSVLIALIRPSKKHLQGKSWEYICSQIWEKPTDGSYYFKRSHSFSYALAIVVQLNRISELMNGG